MRDKKRITLIVLVVIALFLVTYGVFMIRHRMRYAVTDAVFVDTENINNVGFQKVGGRIIKMTKLEGDEVRKGELLAEIDSRNYQLIVQELMNSIASKQNKRDKLRIRLRKIIKVLDIRQGIAKDKVRQTKNKIRSLKKKVASLDARIAQLKRDVHRYKALYRNGAVARRSCEKIETELISRQRERDSLVRKLYALQDQLSMAIKEVSLVIADRKTIDEIKKSIKALDKEIASLKARLKNARLNLKYCKLVSPVNGRVAKKYVSVGNVVSPGIPVYALIDPKDIYILVLLEETKLKGVEPGCPANIKIDAYPDLRYKGVVKEILPASAAKFALVPRDISAGEFTKVVQRMQVKVKITEGDISKLVVGMGGEIEIKRL